MTSRACTVVIAPWFALLAGCGRPAEAPADIEALARFLWDRFEIKDGTDVALQEQEIHDAIRNLDAALAELDTPVRTDAPFKNVLDDLDADRVRDLEGMSDRLDSLGLAQGLVVANVIEGCSLAQLTNLLLSKDQPTIHPGVYESYEKRFDDDDDVDAFRAGDLRAVFWRTTYGAAPVPGSAYTATTRAGARLVPASDAAAFGDVLMDRVHLPQPAEFSVGAEDSSFDLDFQFETYHQRDDGVLHFYPMWRRMKLGLVDSSQDAFISFSLDNMVEWDNQLEQACADGLAD